MNFTLPPNQWFVAELTGEAGPLVYTSPPVAWKRYLRRDEANARETALAQLQQVLGAGG